MRVCRLVCLSTAVLLATAAVTTAQDVPTEPTGDTSSAPGVPGETPTTEVIPPTSAVDPGVTSEAPGPGPSPEVPSTSTEVPPTSPEVPPPSPEVPSVSPEVPSTSAVVPPTPDPGAVPSETPPVQPSPDPAVPSPSTPEQQSSVDSSLPDTTAATDGSSSLVDETTASPTTSDGTSESNSVGAADSTSKSKASSTSKGTKPSSTSSDDDSEESNDGIKSGKSISGGAIAGIVIAILAAFALLLGYLFWRRRQQRKAYLESSVDYNEFPEYDPTSMSDPHISQSASHDPAAAGFYGEKSGQFDHHPPADDHLGNNHAGANVFDISPHQHHSAGPRHLD
ncbi:hypothetical protein LPJ75_003964 [Coemansia sp. RSA 2598]|nr:hypothetical protein LPJ75_003964 [Coemansia sp. RSA 2598]